jgi:hypothetical protein
VPGGYNVLLVVVGGLSKIDCGDVFVFVCVARALPANTAMTMVIVMFFSIANLGVRVKP